jgi:hypothetical protein
MGMMSGSRNKFSRNGWTASSESGPPSWNITIPTLFFPANYLLRLRVLFKRSTSWRKDEVRLATLR